MGFDNKLFVNGFYDNNELEKCLSCRNWADRIDYPGNYLPDDLKSALTVTEPANN
jgi:hypothetical protein